MSAPLLTEEDEIREDQNSNFIQGKAVHSFEELTAILDYMPAGYWKQLLFPFTWKP